jgi:hypothetical protein
MIPTARAQGPRRETGETSGASETCQTRAKFNSLPLPAFSETAGVVSTARIERPLLHRGGSASTETIPAASPSHSEAARCTSTGIVPATPLPFSAS